MRQHLGSRKSFPEEGAKTCWRDWTTLSWEPNLADIGGKIFLTHAVNLTSPHPVLSCVTASIILDRQHTIYSLRMFYAFCLIHPSLLHAVENLSLYPVYGDLSDFESVKLQIFPLIYNRVSKREKRESERGIGNTFTVHPHRGWRKWEKLSCVSTVLIKAEPAFRKYIHPQKEDQPAALENLKEEDGGVSGRW